MKVSGQGTQPMLFAHGFGCDQNMWRFVAPEFERDYKVILFDYVGSGASDIDAYDPERYASLEGYAQDVLDVCHELDLRDVIFVGHSVSGMIGVLAANQEPDLFDRLVMVSPSPRYIDEPPEYTGGFSRPDLEGLLEMMDRNYLGWANFLAPVITKNPDHPEIGAELEASFCSTDPVIARRFAEATFFADNRSDAAATRVPALIIQVADDAIAPRPVGEYLHANMPGSSLAVLDVSGHCPHMSNPQETIEAIREYLASEPAAVPTG